MITVKNTWADMTRFDVQYQSGCGHDGNKIELAKLNGVMQ